MHDNLKSSHKQMLNLARVATCAQRASYKISLRVAKAKKPYAVGETVVISCIKDICQEMLGEIAA